MSALATIELEESMNSTQDDPGGSHSVVSTNSIKSKSNEELHAESTVDCGGREIYQQLPSENVDGGRNDLREKQGELESRLFDEESGHDLHHNDENATPSRKRKRTRSESAAPARPGRVGVGTGNEKQARKLGGCGESWGCGLGGCDTPAPFLRS